MAPSGLSDSQLQSFSRQGFVNLGQLFDDEELHTISTEYDRLVTDEAQVLGNEEDGFFPYRAMSVSYTHLTLPTKA